MKFLLMTLVLFISKASSIEIGIIKANVKIGKLPENVKHSEPATKHYQNLVDTVIRLAEVGWDHVKERYEPFRTSDINFSIWKILEVHVQHAYVEGLFKTKKSSNTVNETILGRQRIMKVSVEEENKAFDIIADLTVRNNLTGNVVIKGTYEIKVEDVSQEGAIGIEEDHHKNAYQITSAELKLIIKSCKIKQIRGPRNISEALPAGIDRLKIFDDIARGVVQHGIEMINKNLENFTISQMDVYLGLSPVRPYKN